MNNRNITEYTKIMKIENCIFDMEIGQLKMI